MGERITISFYPAESLRGKKDFCSLIRMHKKMD